MADDFDMFGPFGWDPDAGEDWSLGAGIEPFNLAGHLGKDLLLIAEPMVPGSGSEDDQLEFFAPFGDIPDDWAFIGAQRQTVYVAATRGRSTANDDEPPAQHVPGRLLPWNFGARLFAGVNPLERGDVASGVLRLADPDGRLNSLIGKNWDTAPLTLKRGPRNTPFKDWEVVGRFKSAGLLRDIDEKQIAVRDLGWQLEAPLHGMTYLGTGGVEGEVAMTGKLKPWALGYCFNVEPNLISTADQIFQWSFTSSQAVQKFMHGAIEIDYSGDDYPTYAALAAAIIPAGEYATCLAQSLARPNITLQYGIRVDVIGDADEFEGHPGPTTRAGIIRRIVTAYGANYLDGASEIDASSFQRMDAYHSAPVGFFFGSPITKAQAVDRVLKGILGWARVRPDGRFTVGWVEAPEQMTAVITFVYGAHGMGKPRLIATSPPRRGTRIGYNFNNAPQPDRGSLAPLADEDDVRERGQEANFAESLRPAIGTLYPTSDIVTIADSGFATALGAENEAERQQVIFDVERFRWSWDLQVDPFIDLIGSAAQFSGAPEIVGEGRALLCAGINATGSSVNTFEFFV